ncbi:DNA-binding XRE family transcriptional regulator [Lachnotalea glycerini]|uniref:XRE family transcriptional regulator n=1 Tax=Lachnotalea glycerini TaxID=1763509 RepID=A0A255IPQ0_9FIRM|nr:helix-turn-helix transcriptional regulator [Lachnotalea glycerini]PXV87742.1 DNA-binding XRE family transcriptional regulator [Lachnotalea glycerini]RDY32090.1 XRE family transcriptional regulator [Lachnotalea glycerini]
MERIHFDKIGLKIKEARMARNLTQENVADEVGINTSHVSNIETNKTKVSLSTLVLICNALDVSVDYILESELKNSSSAIEREIINEIQNFDNMKKEQLLRIAKVL